MSDDETCLNDLSDDDIAYLQKKYGLTNGKAGTTKTKSVKAVVDLDEGYSFDSIRVKYGDSHLTAQEAKATGVNLGESKVMGEATPEKATLPVTDDKGLLDPETAKLMKDYQRSKDTSFGASILRFFGFAS
jgi:hypothetical protein